jgi:hypothetical protein
MKLMEQAIVDAYGESEQRAGFFAMLQDSLTLPFETDVLGLTVTIERIDLTDSGEIIAVAAEGARRYPFSTCRCPTPRLRARSGSRRTVAGHGAFRTVTPRRQSVQNEM